MKKVLPSTNTIFNVFKLLEKARKLSQIYLEIRSIGQTFCLNGRKRRVEILEGGKEKIIWQRIWAKAHSRILSLWLFFNQYNELIAFSHFS